MDEYEFEKPTAKFPRSNSLPNLRDLTIGYVDGFIPHPRRRANSEVVPTVSHNFLNIISLLLKYYNALNNTLFKGIDTCGVRDGSSKDR